MRYATVGGHILNVPAVDADHVIVLVQICIVATFSPDRKNLGQEIHLNQLIEGVVYCCSGDIWHSFANGTQHFICFRVAAFS